MHAYNTHNIHSELRVSLPSATGQLTSAANMLLTAAFLAPFSPNPNPALAVVRFALGTATAGTSAVTVAAAAVAVAVVVVDRPVEPGAAAAARMAALMGDSVPSSSSASQHSLHPVSTWKFHSAVRTIKPHIQLRILWHTA
jgi:hypothetical protein